MIAAENRPLRHGLLEGFLENFVRLRPGNLLAIDEKGRSCVYPMFLLTFKLHFSDSLKKLFVAGAGNERMRVMNVHLPFVSISFDCT